MWHFSLLDSLFILHCIRVKSVIVCCKGAFSMSSLITYPSILWVTYSFKASLLWLNHTAWCLLSIMCLLSALKCELSHVLLFSEASACTIFNESEWMNDGWMILYLLTRPYVPWGHGPCLMGGHLVSHSWSVVSGNFCPLLCTHHSRLVLG